MRAGLELFARRWWAGELGARGRALSVVTAPLSWTWEGAAALAGRRSVARAMHVEGLRVVSVGNLAVGGTGKTPIAAWVASRLEEEGFPTALLLGGSGGDEARLLEWRVPGIPVVEDRDRVAGARRARAAGASVVVMDDGFQHRRLGRDLDIVLLAAEDAFPGHVLPRGPYRERPEALRRAHMVIVTRRAATVDAARSLAERVGGLGLASVAACVELAGSRWTDVTGRLAAAPRGDVLAVCGIARPGVFRSTVALTVAGSTELVAFRDHHEYTAADLSRLRRRAGRRPIVITEKDAVKLRAFAGDDPDLLVLSEELRWDWGEQDVLGGLRTAARAPS